MLSACFFVLPFSCLLPLQVLAANSAGTAVILTNHSNCERGYLPVYVSKFTAALEALASGSGSASPAAAGAGAASPSGAALPATSFECVISAVDADPLVTL